MKAVRAVIRVRPATSQDASAIAAIYAHHVLHGTATFDTVPPDVALWQTKLTDMIARGFPALVAEDEGGSITGYAYATQFRDRAAYRFTCEDSIYVHPDVTGRGVGSALLEALIVAAEAAGFRQMIAVVGGGEPASVALHARHGFVHAGRMRNVGHKFGRWLDTVYMQRSLGEGATSALDAAAQRQKPEAG